MKKNILKNSGVQTLLAALICIILGLFIGFVVLLFINPAGAGEAIITVVKNFLTYSKPATQMKYLGNTLVKTAPLLMCSLSILFAYIGCAGGLLLSYQLQIPSGAAIIFFSILTYALCKIGKSLYLCTRTK